MEKLFQAVMAVFQDGWKVTDVADRLGMSRQTVYKWITRYEAGSVLALDNRSHRSQSCAHQISPELEAAICEIRRKHPGWGPRRILHKLSRAGVEPLPRRSSIYRCLKRHSLIDLRDPPQAPRRVHSMGAGPSHAVMADGCHVRRGAQRRHRSQGRDRIDDHSRFCVAAGACGGRRPRR
jgi:transposase